MIDVKSSRRASTAFCVSQITTVGRLLFTIEFSLITPQHRHGTPSNQDARHIKNAGHIDTLAYRIYVYTLISIYNLKSNLKKVNQEPIYTIISFKMYLDFDGFCRKIRKNNDSLIGFRLLRYDVSLSRHENI